MIGMFALALIIVAVVVVILFSLNKGQRRHANTPTTNKPDIQSSEINIFKNFNIDIRNIFALHPAYQGYNGNSHEFTLNIDEPLLGVFKKIEIRCFNDNYNIILHGYGSITHQLRTFINTVAAVYGDDDSGSGGISTADEQRLSNDLYVYRSWTKRRPAIMIDFNLNPNEINCTIWGININEHRPDFETLQKAHPAFLGVPICGALNDFIAKMEELGFVRKETVDTQANYISMTGRFGHNENAEITIYYTPQTHTVKRVVVFDMRFTSWGSLKSKYIAYKTALQQKYGIAESYEFFISPYYDGDGRELDALENEKVQYVSFWPIDGGIISLRILNLMIAICFEDCAGVQIDKVEEQNMITNYI